MQLNTPISNNPDLTTFGNNNNSKAMSEGTYLLYNKEENPSSCMNFL
jgi:hypothetical protein